MVFDDRSRLGPLSVTWKYVPKEEMCHSLNLSTLFRKQLLVDRARASTKSSDAWAISWHRCLHKIFIICICSDTTRYIFHDVLFRILKIPSFGPFLSCDWIRVPIMVDHHLQRERNNNYRTFLNSINEAFIIYFELFY